MTRVRPANRRPSETRKLQWVTDTGVHEFSISVGFDPDEYPHKQKLIEVFYSEGLGAVKTGGNLWSTVCDGCILISQLLQHGATPSEIEKSLMVTPVNGENQPATIIGVIAKGLLEWD